MSRFTTGTREPWRMSYVHTCDACAALDHLDGVLDGQPYKAPKFNARHERSLLNHIRRAEDRAADKVTGFAGSLKFVYVHIVWFVVWIVINVGAFGRSTRFDKFPFGLLTMIVSLEAIFLATFVMVSQNRQSARSDIRSAIDFENNLRGEIWAMHIGHRLGIDGGHVEEMVRLALLHTQEGLDAS